MVQIDPVEEEKVEEERIEQREESTSSFKLQEVSTKPKDFPGNASVAPSEAGAVATGAETEQETHSKKGETNGGEGDGWETASEGDENDDADGESQDKEIPLETNSDVDAKSHDENIPTTSRSTGEQFEDALTEEEQCSRALVQANALKAEGNSLYAAGKFVEAMQCYSTALESAPDHPSAKETRAMCYSNRAICLLQLKNYDGAVKEATKALELDAKYIKALTRRAQANEKLERFEEALTDLKVVVELDSGNRQARETIRRLEPLAEAKREKMKEEMLGKLKDLGNSLLGRFGMNVDNFKAVKDPNTGSYSINFQK